MMHQNPWGDDGQRHIYSEAIKLASAGDEYSHLIALMTPEHALRMRCFVAELPDAVRNKTIYGKATSRTIAPSKNK